MARRRKHVPKTRYPTNLEKSYLGALKRLVLSWKKIAQWYSQNYLKYYMLGGALSIDASDDDENNPHKIEQLAALIAMMAVAIKNANSNRELENVATQFVLSINSFSYSNVNSQAKAISSHAIQSNPTIQTFMRAKIKENTSYITSMRDKYVAQLQSDIYRAISDGKGATELTNAIVKRTNMSYNHARLIANDQTGSILAELNKYRATHAGFEKYRWQSMEDGRVRPKHQELDQKIFSYDDPDGGDNGQLPGEPINCRCVALPVIDN